MKLKSLLSALQKASQTLTALEDAGVDVDRLIGISNAQGPQAKQIKSLITGLSSMGDLDLELDQGKKVPSQLSPKKTTPRKSSKK